MGAALAFGTLGVVTLLEVQLKDAREYVQLTYKLSPSVAQASVVLQEESSKETNDYMDAIIFSLDSTAICTGRLVDEVPVQIFLVDSPESRSVVLYPC